MRILNHSVYSYHRDRRATKAPHSQLVPQFALNPTDRVDESRGRSRRSSARRYMPRRLPRPPRARRRLVAARRASTPRAARRPPPVALHLDLSSRPHSRLSPQTESTIYAASPSIPSQSRTLLHAAPTISPSASAASAHCRTPSERPSRSQATASGTAPRSRTAPHFVPKPKTEPTGRAASPPISPKPCAPP